MRIQTKELHNSIKKEFARLSNKKEFGVPKYTKAWILNKLANDFFRSPKTVENIVFERA
ncbi:MAG: hypothetical protein WCY89_01215 [Flavobacteriaceae bacterium]